MRKAKPHYASRGNVQAQGATKTEAKANLERAIDLYLSEPSGAFIETRFGMVLIVVATPNGHDSKVLFPADITEHGKRHWSGSCYGNTDLKSVVMFTRQHAAQCAWTRDSDDADIVARSGLENTGELERWIVWQRAYIAARDDGLSDIEAHKAAFTAKYAAKRESVI